MTYDFAQLNATLTGANASEARRLHNPFATNKQMYAALLHLQQHGPLRMAHSIALRAANSAGLLELFPLTEQQERARKRNANAKLTRKVLIGADGERYIDDLRAVLDAHKPKAVAVRKCAALVVNGHWERVSMQNPHEPWMIAIQNALKSGTGIEIGQDLYGAAQLRIAGKPIRTSAIERDIHTFILAQFGHVPTTGKIEYGVARALVLFPAMKPPPFVTAGRVTIS